MLLFLVVILENIGSSVFLVIAAGAVDMDWDIANIEIGTDIDINIRRLIYRYSKCLSYRHGRYFVRELLLLLLLLAACTSAAARGGAISLLE